MDYNFNINGESVKVWVWNTDFHTNVTVRTHKKSYDRTIHQDNGGKFFTWNKTKVYLKDFVSLSLKELKDKVEKDEYVSADDLCQAIAHDGVENARFICKLNPFSIVVPGLGFGLCDGNKTEEVVCKVSEKRYKVMDGYKIGVVPADPEMLFGSHDYYTSDMISLIRSGHIKIVIE